MTLPSKPSLRVSVENRNGGYNGRESMRACSIEAELFYEKASVVQIQHYGHDTDPHGRWMMTKWAHERWRMADA